MMRTVITGPDMYQVTRVDEWVYNVCDNDGNLIFKTTREMLAGVMTLNKGERATIGRAFPPRERDTIIDALSEALNAARADNDWRLVETCAAEALDEIKKLRDIRGNLEEG